MVPILVVLRIVEQDLGDLFSADDTGNINKPLLIHFYSVPIDKEVVLVFILVV